jgi:hypothetical protein
VFGLVEVADGIDASELIGAGWAPVGTDAAVLAGGALSGGFVLVFAGAGVAAAAAVPSVCMAVACAACWAVGGTVASFTNAAVSAAGSVAGLKSASANAV